MAENVIFQTKTFGGFDKKSVLEYIDKAAEQARKKEEEFDRQLSQMQQKNQELEQEKDALTDVYKRQDERGCGRLANHHSRGGNRGNKRLSDQ